MSAPKLTPEFPPHIKPVHVGVYPVRTPELGESADGYAYWDGKQWSPQVCTARSAFAQRGRKATYQSKHWRGLTKKGAV